MRAAALFVGALALLYAADGSRQPTSGSGWRMLAYQRGLGQLNTVTLLPDQAAIVGAWEALRLRGTTPTVDGGRVLVVQFTGIGSIGCPTRFEGLRIDSGRQLVAGSLSRAITSGCDENTVPDSFIVAIDRERLPAAPFRIQLSDPLPPNAPGASIEVGG